MSMAAAAVAAPGGGGGGGGLVDNQGALSQSMDSVSTVTGEEEVTPASQDEQDN